MTTALDEALARLTAETERAEAVLASRRSAPRRLPVRRRPTSGPGRRNPEAPASPTHNTRKETP